MILVYSCLTGRIVSTGRDIKVSEKIENYKVRLEAEIALSEKIFVSSLFPCSTTRP